MSQDLKSIFCYKETTPFMSWLLKASSLRLGLSSDDPQHSSGLVQLEVGKILCRFDICRLYISKMQQQLCSMLLWPSLGSATDLLHYANADYIPGYIHSSEHSQEAVSKAKLLKILRVIELCYYNSLSRLVGRCKEQHMLALRNLHATMAFLSSQGRQCAAGLNLFP